MRRLLRWLLRDRERRIEDATAEAARQSFAWLTENQWRTL